MTTDSGAEISLYIDFGAVASMKDNFWCSHHMSAGRLSVDAILSIIDRNVILRG
jgi:hypothetical protein